MQTHTETRAPKGAATAGLLSTPDEAGELRVVFDARSGDPLKPEGVAGPASKAVVSTDYWGAFRVEKFAAASDLSYTHEDAAGWLNYVQKFQARNFWYQDAGVAPWAYYEQYDNWQDTYGMDAVLAVYHSGHATASSMRPWAAIGVAWAPAPPRRTWPWETNRYATSSGPRVFHCGC
jgi:hypothetical protein